MKTYTFKDDGYWDNPPCDCCQNYYINQYYSDDTLPELGDAYTEADCYVYAILSHSGAQISLGAEQDLWTMSVEELEEVAKELGIEVLIE
jgi:hypothetical protein